MKKQLSSPSAVAQAEKKNKQVSDSFTIKLKWLNPYGHVC